MTARIFSIAALILSGSVLLSGAALSQDSNEPLIVEIPKSLPITKELSRPIIGLRESSPSFVTGKLVDTPLGYANNAVFLPESVVVKAWMTDPKFAQAVRNKGLDTINLNTLAASGIDVTKFDWDPIGTDYKSIRPQRIGKDGFSKEDTIDSSAIITMTAYNMLDLSKKHQLIIGKPNSYAIALDARYAEGLVDAYTDSKYYGKFQFSDPTIKWKTPGTLLVEASRKLPIEADKLTVRIGTVSFGKVRLQSAQEVGLKIDKRLAQKYDVYLVELAATLHDLPDDGIEEVSLRVDCTEVCVAWELAPLRVSAEVETTKTIKTPQVTFKDLTVGEIFSKTVTYKSLKPQIVAYGLREDQFSWSLKGDAVGMGSYMFFAAIGVPKGSKELHIIRSVGIRTSDSFFIEGKWAASEDLLEIIPVRP